MEVSPGCPGCADSQRVAGLHLWQVCLQVVPCPVTCWPGATYRSSASPCRSPWPPRCAWRWSPPCAPTGPRTPAGHTLAPSSPSSTPAFPAQTFFECPAGSEDGSWLIKDHAWLWILMFLSQVIFFTTFPPYFCFRSGSPLTFGPQKVAALPLPINCLGQAFTTPFSSSRASLSTEEVMMAKNHASLTSRANILGR